MIRSDRLVDKIKSNPGAKLLLVWGPVLILTVCLGIYHKFFYTEMVQTQESFGYKFKAVVRDDGAVHFTVTKIPDMPDEKEDGSSLDGRGESAAIAVGDDFWIYDDGTLEFGGEEYLCGYVSKTQFSNRYSSEGFVTFPDGQQLEFFTSDDGLPEWNRSLTYDGTSEAFGESLASYFFVEPPSGYPADMIAAAVVAYREVEHNLEHPYVWHWELTFLGLLLTLLAGVQMFCLRASNKRAGERLRLFFEINGEVKVRPWVEEIWKFLGLVYFIVGLVFVFMSYFMRQ